MVCVTSLRVLLVAYGINALWLVDSSYNCDVCEEIIFITVQTKLRSLLLMTSKQISAYWNSVLFAHNPFNTFFLVCFSTRFLHKLGLHGLEPLLLRRRKTSPRNPKTPAGTHRGPRESSNFDVSAQHQCEYHVATKTSNISISTIS
mgnify:CR=1 FL=1